MRFLLNHLNTNLSRNLPLRNFENRLKFDKLWPRVSGLAFLVDRVDVVSSRCTLCNKLAWRGGWVGLRACVQCMYMCVCVCVCVSGSQGVMQSSRLPAEP